MPRSPSPAASEFGNAAHHRSSTRGRGDAEKFLENDSFAPLRLCVEIQRILADELEECAVEGADDEGVLAEAVLDRLLQDHGQLPETAINELLRD